MENTEAPKLTELEVDALVATGKESLVYVKEGREYTKPCTADVVDCVNHRGYTAQKTRNYVISFSGDQIVSVVPGADNIMQRGLKRADADWQVVPKHVMVFHRTQVKGASSAFKVLAAPDRHAKTAVKLGEELAKTKDGSVNPGDLLSNGKFQVLEVRNGIGASQHVLVVQKVA